MKLVANGGTDSAFMVLFWPENLPDVADHPEKWPRDDPTGFLQQLEDDGKLILFPCGSDGMHSVWIFIQCEIPAELAQYYAKFGTYPGLVAKGDCYYGGGEYLFKKELRLTSAFPTAVEKIAIPEGVYTATGYAGEKSWPLQGTWLETRHGTGGVRIRRLQRRLDRDDVAGGEDRTDAIRIRRLKGQLACMGCLSVLATFSLYFVMPTQYWIYLLCVTAALLLAPIFLAQTSAFKKVAKAAAERPKDLPSYIVHLE